MRALNANHPAHVRHPLARRWHNAFGFLAASLLPMLTAPAEAEPPAPAREAATLEIPTGAPASRDEVGPLARRPPRCAPPLRLVACVMNARRPERSKAAIRNANGVRVLGPGQRVDDLVLLAVGPTRALLRMPSGQACYMPVFLSADERRTPAAPPKRISASSGGRGTPSKEELQRGIRATGAGRYAVSGTLLERLAANPRALARTTRIKPLVRNGRAVGVHLTWLSAQSPLALLGLQQGDVLLRINGAPLTDAVGALATLLAQRGTRRVTLTVLRDNRPQNLTLELE